MIGRFDRESRRLKHWSTVPFTVLATTDERDVEFPDGTVLPGPAASVRATPDWHGLEIDPTPPSPPPPSRPNTVLGYVINPPVWIGGPPGRQGIEGHLEEVFRCSSVHGLAISGRRSGLLFFDFTGWRSVPLIAHDDMMFDQAESLQNAWLETMNAHALCLVSAILELRELSIEKREVTPRDLVFGHGEALSGPGLISLWGLRSLPPPSQIISEVMLSRSAELLDNVLEKGDIGVALVALLNRAACYCEERNFPLAVVTAWTLVERLLNIRWERLGISRRKPKAAKMVDELIKRKQLPDRLLPSLAETRTARNAWVHAGRIPAWKEAATALETAREMILDILGVRLSVPLVRSLSF